MATHRAMQAAAQTVTASAPMSDLMHFQLSVTQSFKARLRAAVNLTLLLSSYQRRMAIFMQCHGRVRSPIRPGIDTLLPSTTPISTLRTRENCRQRRIQQHAT